MRNSPENTSKRDPAIHLMGILSVGQGSYIEGLEAAGQRELIHSSALPSDMKPGEATFLSLGFTFGPVDKFDSMFRPATLPAGWRKEGSDHSMWSYIVDELGRRRVAIFYKAAFYDRSAFMRLVTVKSYVSDLLDEGAAPVYDETWCTPRAVYDALGGIRAHQVEREQFYASGVDDPWAVEELKEIRQKLSTLDRFAAAVPATGQTSTPEGEAEVGRG